MKCISLLESLKSSLDLRTCERLSSICPTTREVRDQIEKPIIFYVELTEDPALTSAWDGQQRSDNPHHYIDVWSTLVTLVRLGYLLFSVRVAKRSISCYIKSTERDSEPCPLVSSCLMPFFFFFFFFTYIPVLFDYRIKLFSLKRFLISYADIFCIFRNFKD